MAKRLIFSLLTVFCLSNPIFGQINLSYYLPQNSYNESIPTPKEVLGYEVGEWHVNNDQLVRYMEAVAKVSDRVSLEIYGRSYEHRPLLLLTITSPDNHKNIESIRKNHIGLSEPSHQNNQSTANMPAVVWLGYSVHGNESSGTNASLLTVYHLAAATGAEIDEMLKNTVILVDPMINPDGNMRFSSWVNSRKSKNLIADPNNHEQNEPWPKGRTNHYWFDLNRDWLLLQHPESKGRIKKFHQWKPNVLTDHHEMGTNATFFFQPGIPSRNHPLTPENTFTLTGKIAEFHKKALDENGSLYYSKESFDDYYYGKGSTYPDINGGVGILFEQASSRSHAQKSINGTLKFPFTIKNQFTVTLSTLASVQQMRTELLDHQKEFYKTAMASATNDPVKAIAISSEFDVVRLNAMIEILRRHDIKVYKLNKSITRGGRTFDPGHSCIIPLVQPQYQLIKALFESRTEFQDSLFYDVSAWTLPLAFNLPYAEIGTKAFHKNLLGEQIINLLPPANTVKSARPSYAYGINWNGYLAPRALYKLLKAGMRVKVATQPFTHKNGKEYNYGTIIIPLHHQPLSPERIHILMDEIKGRDSIEVYHFNSGSSIIGNYLGSNNMKNISLPKIALIIGDGINGQSAGEVWHLLDERFDVELTLLPVGNLSNVKLENYNTLILAGGNHSRLGPKIVAKIKSWTQSGGNIVAMQNASRWLSDMNLTKTKFKTSKKPDKPSLRPYVGRSRYRGAQLIGGAIFATTLDLTHPLAYGYSQKLMPIFKKGILFMESTDNPYANPVMYTQNPLMSGYVSKENLNKLQNTAAVNISSLGAGKIISFTDNLNFRAYWYGTNKMFFNAIYFGDIIDL